MDVIRIAENRIIKSWCDDVEPGALQQATNAARQAQRELNLEDEKKRLDDKGIVHSIRREQDLDEAAGAYKDIDSVMEQQQDLVKVLHKLEPLAVIKG